MIHCFETPGLRAYTLQEAYNTFGSRGYTDVHYKKESTGCFISFCDSNGRKWPMQDCDMIIDGIVISSGHIHVRIRQKMGESACAYFTLDELARDFQWPDGSSCGVVTLTHI